MIYFSSDFHLGHKAIVKYRKQFNTTQEHDSIILDKISELNKRDILYVLGDFLFDGEHYDDYIKELSKMSCRIKLVLGNHDSLKLYKETRAPKIELQLPLFSYKNIWVSHAPIHNCELRDRKGNIHGHLHNHIVPDKRYFNVNLDNNNFNFVEFDNIKDILI